MNKTSIFDKFGKNGLREFSKLCSVHCSVSPESIENLAISAIRYYSNGAEDDGWNSEVLLGMQKRWYNSLEAGKPDYSVYGEPAMLAETWACWSVYSRKYLLEIKKGKLSWIQKEIGDLPIADVGCGCGHTTAALCEIFPKSLVVGTNIESSIQFSVAKQISDGKFKVEENVPHGIEFGLLFASEYFEHHERPIDHLIEIANACKPKIMVIANSFGSKSVGHFNLYFDLEGDVISKSAIGRKFNDTLRGLGYEKIKTGLWNDRPSVWRKQNAEQETGQ